MSHDDVMEMLADTAARLVETVLSLDDEDWAKPGLGEWTVRELVGHTLRAFSTIDRFLDEPGDVATVESAADYYRIALGSIPDVHVQVAARGREAGMGLGDDPKEAVVEQVSATLGRLGDTDGTEVGRTVAGHMRLVDYLDTRLVELVVHLSDLCAAIDRPLGDLGAAGTRAAATIISSATPDDRDRIVRAVLGRASLPAGFNVWP